MKKFAVIAVVLGALLFAVRPAQAENGWATAGKILTGVVAADVLINHTGGHYGGGYGYGGVGFSYGHYGKHSGYSFSYYGGAPVYYAPAPVYYYPAPAVVYRPCYPRYYRPYPSHCW